MQFSRAAIVTFVLLGTAPAFGEESMPNAGTTDPATGQNASAVEQTAPAVEDAGPLNSAPSATPEVESPHAASKLEELITSRLTQFVDRKPEQQAVETFYRERAFQPIWSANGIALPRARAALDYLTRVASEGLDPRDYPRPDFSRDMREETAATSEIQLTASVLNYARHARAGRVSFTRVSGSILYPPHAVDPAQVLTQVSSADDVVAELSSFEPQHPGFKALKAQLARELSASDTRRTASQPNKEGSG